MAYPRFQRSRAHKFATRTAGTLSITTTTWADLTTAMDLTLEAQVGDVIEYGVVALWDSQAVAGYLDVASVVSNAVVTQFFSGGAQTSAGVTAWYGIASAFSSIGGGVMFALSGSDLSGGQVTLRPRGRISAAGSKSIYATTDFSLQVWAKNLGPVDPN